MIVTISSKAYPDDNGSESWKDGEYISFGDSKSLRIRGQAQLVLKNGWLDLDFDQQGFLVGMEFREGDPFGGKAIAAEYLHPIIPKGK